MQTIETVRIVKKEFMPGARTGLVTRDKRGPLLTEAGPGGEDDVTSAPRGERSQSAARAEKRDQWGDRVTQQSDNSQVGEEREVRQEVGIN